MLQIPLKNYKNGKTRKADEQKRGNISQHISVKLGILLGCSGNNILITVLWDREQIAAELP